MVPSPVAPAGPADCSAAAAGVVENRAAGSVSRSKFSPAADRFNRQLAEFIEWEQEDKFLAWADKPTVKGFV